MRGDSAEKINPAKCTLTTYSKTKRHYDRIETAIKHANSIEAVSAKHRYVELRYNENRVIVKHYHICIERLCDL